MYSWFNRYHYHPCIDYVNSCDFQTAWNVISGRLAGIPRRANRRSSVDGSIDDCTGTWMNTSPSFKFSIGNRQNVNVLPCLWMAACAECLCDPPSTQQCELCALPAPLCLPQHWLLLLGRPIAPAGRNSSANGRWRQAFQGDSATSGSRAFVAPPLFALALHDALI